MTQQIRTHHHVISAEENHLITRIAERVAAGSSLQRGSYAYKRAVDLAITLLTECHRLCRPLALAAMARAEVSQIKADLSALRQNFNMGSCTLPHTIDLHFEARFWQE